MRHPVVLTIVALGLVGCGGARPAESPASATGAEATASESDATLTAGPAEAQGTPVEGDSSAENEFVLRDSATAKHTHGATPSKIKPTHTEAALKFFVIDKDKGPVEGIVISLTSPDGKKYYTEETDSTGYAEVLVPIGQKYDLVYLSLGRKDIAASVPVSAEPNQNIKLTLRYKRNVRTEPPRFILEGVEFDTGKATIRPESYPRLDRVVEYMTYKKKARIQISGHTDNVGSPEANKTLSDRRAKACRDYLISKGIEGSRITAVGYGEERPIATNTTAEGRQKNRRIEASEL